MKNLKYCAVLILLLIPVTVFSQSGSDSLNRKQSDSTISYTKMVDSLLNVYGQSRNNQTNNYREPNKQGNNLFGVSVDIIVGVGHSNTSYDINSDSAGINNTGSKTYPVIGANISIRLAGFAFGTGLNYTSKGFASNNSNTFNANYLNFPLLFSYSINIKKTGIDLSAGPYIGVLLSQDNSQLYSLKNIDVGVTGGIQGSYTFNNVIGVLLGFKYEQGGLNNLLKTNSTGNNISSIKTTNWSVYSGIKFNL